MKKTSDLTLPTTIASSGDCRSSLKSIPRSVILYVLGILALWTLYRTTISSSTLYMGFIVSVHDFLINQGTLPLPKTDTRSFQRTYSGHIGLEVMRNTDVTFLGAAKDIADTLPGVLKQIDELATYFRSSRAVFVEGDSIDNTKDLLLQWASKSSSNRTILLLYNQTTVHENTGFFSNLLLPREGRIAAARNLALAYIRKLPPTAYLIVVDLDQFGWDVTGIIDSFSRKHWDVMCSHGIFLHGVYRDSYAFRADGINTNHHRCGDDHLMYNISVEQRAANRRDLVVSL
jgi:hypothetical protein